MRVRHCWTDTAVQRAQFQPAKLSHNDVLLRFVDSRADRFAARSTHPTGGRRGTRDARRGHTHTWPTNTLQRCRALAQGRVSRIFSRNLGGLFRREISTKCVATACRSLETGYVNLSPFVSPDDE